MNNLYVIARKTKGGAVEIYKPQDSGPARLWVTFDQYRSDKPDYRHRYVTLNCYRYPIMWNKTSTQEQTP